MRKTILLVVIGLFITGTVWSWSGDYPVIRTKTKVTIPKTSPGLKVLVNRYESVRVVNPKPIKDGCWIYKYGDTCRIDDGWEAEVVGAVRGTNQILLRVSNRPKSEVIGCPVEVLFFLSVHKIKQMLYREAKRKADEAAEHEAVKRLLENNQKKKP